MQALADPFTNIGFPYPQLSGFVKGAIRIGQLLPSAHGSYYRWASASGAELWVVVDASRRVVSSNPHFSGKGHMSFRVGGFHSEPPTDYPLLEGAITGWAGADPVDPDAWLCPLTVSLPDFDIQKESVRVSSLLDLQVAAFATSIRVLPSEAEFLASQEEIPSVMGPVKFSPEYFIPTSLCRATFAGRVQEGSVLENDLSRQKFHHIVVQTAAGSLDVVAEKSMVAGPPTVGGVVEGDFWLSGRPRS